MKQKTANVSGKVFTAPPVEILQLLSAKLIKLDPKKVFSFVELIVNQHVSVLLTSAAPNSARLYERARNMAIDTSDVYL